MFFLPFSLYSLLPASRLAPIRSFSLSLSVFFFLNIDTRTNNSTPIFPNYSKERNDANENLKEKTKPSKDECTHISIPNNIVEVGRKQKKEKETTMKISKDYKIII